MFRWFMRDRTERITSLQIQTLRKVNHLMVGFNDVVAKIEELKAVEKKMADELHDVSAKLKDCMGKEIIDPAAVQAAHDALVGVISDMEQKIHSDGM